MVEQWTVAQRDLGSILGVGMVVLLFLCFMGARAYRVIVWRLLVSQLLTLISQVLVLCADVLRIPL